MFGNRRKTIGLFISEIYDEYQDTLSRGIIGRAQELNYNMAVFTNFGGVGQVIYDAGEAYMATLPNYEELDGIIIAGDVIKVTNLKEQYIDGIKNRSHCPVVSVRSELEDVYNILIDDNTVLDEIIRHFITKHGFTRINFLSGPKGSVDAERRLDNYRRVLKEYNIPVEEDRIYYGDFWKREGANAVNHWLDSDLEYPQAIICANDHMAVTVCRALAARGISVPDQIAVTGCDDLEDAAEFSPSITTSRMPVFEMGVEAVNKIHKHNLGIAQPQYTYMKTETIYRSSCGCKRNWYHESNDRRRNHISTREILHREIYRTAYMSTDLTGLSSLDEVVDKMKIYIYENVNLSGFCMCLQWNWDLYRDEIKEEQDISENDYIMEIGVKGQTVFTKVKCSKKELLPRELSEDIPLTYFFAPLHHQQHYFGYVGISFSKVQTYMRTFQGWMINVSNALENVRIHSELNRLVYKLEDMSIRDDLTGLYNRRVINTLGKKYLNQCMVEKENLMVFTADMDKLKFINDKFGHSYGDKALKAVANALIKVADDDEICIRLGGDEFMAIGIDYDEAKVGEFINRFVGELDEFNRNSGYEFGVYVSYGYKLILPNEETSIENCLKSADALMYQQKYEKASKSIKANLIV